jgi:hypothetical protein
MLKVKFHLSDDGIARKCSATKVPCKMTHFENKEAAEQYNLKKLEKEFQNIPTLSKKVATIELQGALGAISLDDGDLSNAKARSTLINGMCGDLATAIQRKTGGEPYFVCYGINSEEELKKTFENEPEQLFDVSTHVMIESPTSPGNFVDAYGQKTASDLREFYGEEITVIRGDLDMLNAYSDSQNFEKLSNFADAALDLDSKCESYSYMDFSEV